MRKIIHHRGTEAQRIFEAYSRKLRRTFLFLAVLCASVPLWFNEEAQAQTRPEIRGVWIHTYAPFDWETEMKKLADAGFNCVFARVARGANSIYPSQFLERDDWAQTQTEDEMQKAIAAAHANGLEFHAWKVCFNLNGAAKQTGPAKTLYDQMAKDDRLVRGIDGMQAPFLNPADPRNQKLELDALREIIEKYDVDGIHLDYIRYPDEPHFDFDYGTVSRFEFEKFRGQKVPNWPADVFSGDLKWDYENWERAQINSLVKNVYEQTKTLKPRVQVSAAVWRAHRTYRAKIKQDWVLWAKNNWLDFVVPMDYTSDETQFREDVRGQIANSAGRVFLAAGIGNYKHETPEQTLKQIETARQEGADGFVLFDYKPQKYEALLAAMKAEKGQKPSLPFRAPKVTLAITGGVSRKDDVPAFDIGASLYTWLHIPKKQVEEVKVLILHLEWQNLNNGASQLLKKSERHILYPNEIYPDSNQAVSLLPLPEGRWQLVVKAIAIGQKKKSAAPFEIRGPIIEGLPPETIAELRAREKPPIVSQPGKRVAIYAGGMADSGLLKVLQNAPDIAAYPIYSLKPEHWRGSGVLLLPQLRDVEEFSPQVVTDLRDWVSNGGTLLLTHDAVGFRSHLRAFPEIGQGVALSKTREVEMMENEFGFARGKWQHEYVDHVSIAPGANGKIIARDNDGQAVFVGGNFGKGRVFLYGSLLGYAPSGVLGAGETQLLLDLMKN